MNTTADTTIVIPGSVRIFPGSDWKMVSFRTADGREGYEYITDEGEVDTAADSHLRCGTDFKDEEVDRIHAELCAIVAKWDFIDTAA